MMELLISNSNPLQLTAEKTMTIVGVWEKSYLNLEILAVCLVSNCRRDIIAG